MVVFRLGAVSLCLAWAVTYSTKLWATAGAAAVTGPATVVITDPAVTASPPAPAASERAAVTDGSSNSMGICERSICCPAGPASGWDSGGGCTGTVTSRVSRWSAVGTDMTYAGVCSMCAGRVCRLGRRAGAVPGGCAARGWRGVTFS